MADIVIRGMKMPESCHKCRMLEGDTMDGLCHAAGKWLDDESFAWFQYAEDDLDMSKPLNCPLVEVKTPRGRLIDADALKVKAIERSEKCGVCVNVLDNVITAYDIETAPTIIPAEEGE